MRCRTCNELNAGYAADGFCRRKGVGACVFTYCVGGLSLINACAGCYSEDLPVIFISGGVLGLQGVVLPKWPVTYKCVRWLLQQRPDRVFFFRCCGQFSYSRTSGLGV
jgi:hypothetical protein